MREYRPRGIERRFAGTTASAKVVVVEGARAVGKTRLMRHLVERGVLRTFADLTEPTTRAAADADLEGWLRSLPAPAVIDEAQLIDELPLAVKRIVDERDLGLQFVLTGSSSIGRSSLAGRDPLAGRAERLVLRTFSETERRGLAPRQPSSVELLFDGAPVAGTTPEVDERTLLERIERGGLPEFALGGAGERSRRAARVRDDVLDALGRGLHPEDRFDAVRVRDTLDAIVRAPGRILNAVTLGQALQTDRRTVERYVSILERRFLLTRLPNLAMSPSSQPTARSKAHAFDTAVAAESLRRSGVDLQRDRERFGQLLESWVAQQLLSAATWSSFPVDAFYWRRSQRPTSEVDLVLVDDRGRTVGVEVKAAREVRSSDADGLRALARARALHRGYVLYLGRTVVPLGDDIWALPITMLDDPEGFEMPGPDDVPTPAPVASPWVNTEDSADATLFLSYAHADDDYLGGAMLRFATALQDSYRFQFGSEIRIFTDRSDLGWGVAWQRQLDAAAQDTRFLLAMVTPTYLRSDACRREFEQFLAASSGDRDELVLTLLWVPLPPAKGDDPVRAHVDAHQWEDAKDLASLEPGTAAYRAVVEGIARRLRETAERREESTIHRDHTRAENDEPDLLEQLLGFEAARPRFEAAVQRFGEAMGGIGTTFERAGTLGRGDTYASAAALDRLGKQLAGPVEQLEAATTALTREWGVIDHVFSSMIAVLPYVSDDDGRADLARTLVELQVELDLPQVDEFDTIAGVLGSVSRHLRPAGRALKDALRALRSMQHSVGEWRRRVE